MTGLVNHRTIQSKSILVSGDPNGQLGGAPGLVIIDPSSAVIWYKNSPAEITTGWVALSGAGLISLILSQIGMFAVHSIDDLMAIASAATNKFATYDGWVTGGDAGGSAFYHWDSLSVETHNGFSVVQPLDQGVDPTVPGRWVQKPA